MRKLSFLLVAVVALSLCMPAPVAAQSCTAIQDGTLLSSSGETLAVGYNSWGYNYQAHIFNGGYCDAYQNATWCQPYADVELEMKWNDAWLSNKDCDGDQKLDRYFGFLSFVGSGAWLTNHQKGVYIDENGKKQRWTYFVKIVAVPAGSTLVGGVYYALDGTEIGPMIWDQFAIVQEVSNDTGSGTHGAQYVSPYSAGFGKFSPVK